MRRIIDICWRLCKQVPLLPITILSAIPLALLGEWKPWGEAAWDSWISQVGVDGLSAFNPGVGQWIVIVGQRAYGRRDRRRISYCQSVRFWRNGQPRR